MESQAKYHLFFQPKLRQIFLLLNRAPVSPVEEPPLAAVRPWPQEGHEGLDEGQAAGGHADGRVRVDLDGLQLEGVDLEPRLPDGKI